MGPMLSGNGNSNGQQSFSSKLLQSKLPGQQAPHPMDIQHQVIHHEQQNDSPNLKQ